MTEEEAREWVGTRFGTLGIDAMEQLIALVCAESGQQNLVSASTLDAIWNRHIVDSAQLVALAEGNEGRWIDIGTGAGFPGLVVAALSEREMILVEPRRRRAEFLQHCCERLRVLNRVEVRTSKIERVEDKGAVLSARAVAYLGDLLASAQKCSTWNTLWLFPKGRSAREEIASARRTWHGRFHVEQSLTDAESLVVVAKEVSRR